MSIEGRYYGEVADDYDAKRRSTRTHRAESDAFAKLFARGLGSAPIASVLDLPCGTGRWIPLFHKAGLDYCGVDISRDMLLHAKQTIDGLKAERCCLIEASCFDFLPEHAGAFDLVVSTRFINWWDEATGAQLIRLLCGASRQFAILHVRVDDTPLQRALSTVLRYPNRLRKTIKDREHRHSEIRRLLKRFSSAPDAAASRHPYISYHNRAASLSSIADAGFSLVETVVLKKHAYGSVEFWLVRRNARSPAG